jgi:hypothetical protein
MAEIISIPKPHFKKPIKENTWGLRVIQMNPTQLTTFHFLKIVSFKV